MHNIQVEQGSLNSSTGTIIDADTRLRTADFVEIKNFNKIDCKGMTTCNVFFYDTNKTYLGRASTSWETLPFQFEILQNAVYLKAIFRKDDEVVTPDMIKNLRLYSEETDYLLYIQQEMLRGDYFVKEANGWKEVHGIIKTVIDGVNTKVRSLKLIANNTMIQFAADPEKVLNKNGIAVSNCFKQSKNWAVINTVVISDLGALYFHCKSDVISEITNDAMNALLQQMYEQGNPLICYATATNSEKLTCTKEQSAVLEELSNLDLFSGVNNIITAEDIALLKLKYALDVETYVDNKIDEKLANINQQILNMAGGN